MTQHKAYILIGSMAFFPLSMVGYIVLPKQSPVDTPVQEGMITIRKSVAHPREFITRPAPLNPSGTALASITPIELDGVRYEEMWYPYGTIKATDLRTHEILWQKQVYSIRPPKGTSTQPYPVLFSFFKEGTWGNKGTYLKVINEKGESFAVDPQTGDVFSWDIATSSRIVLTDTKRK